MIINRANLGTLFTGYKAVFQGAFDVAESHCQKVAMTVPSTTSKEVYGWLGRTTGFHEWMGERVIQNLSSHDFTLRNRSFENTVGVDRDTIEDDQFGIYTPMIAQLGQDARTHPDELVFGLLREGFAAPCYDGQYFFSANHPVNVGGAVVSVPNMQPGAGTPWFLLDVSKAVKPLIFQKRRDYSFVAMDRPDDEAVFSRKEYRYGVDARVNAGFGLWQMAFGSRAALDKDNYAAARAAMMGVKGDNGRPLNIRPGLLLVPPSLEAAGLEVLKAERDVSGATNVYRDTADLLVCPWLA